MKKTIYFHREKEENWEIIDKCEAKGFKNTDGLRYLGNEIKMLINIDEDCNVKVISINNIDVSDKNIEI